MSASIVWAVVHNRVETVWAKVFQNSNTVLKHAKDFGFLGMEIIPSPNIHQIMLQLKTLKSQISILIDFAPLVDMEYEQVRQLLNAKSQLETMERVAAALAGGNQEDFDQQIAELERQSVI